MSRQLASDVPVQFADFPVEKQPLTRGVLSALQALDQLRPDTLVTYNWGSMYWWVAKRFRPKLLHVHVEDGFGPEEKERQYRRRVLCRRLTLNDPATVTVLPSLTLLNIARNQWSLPGRRLVHISNGIDSSRFDRAADTRDCRSSVVIGTVATLRPEKNIARLIRLFNEAAQRAAIDLELLIVGGGSEWGRLNEIARASPFSQRIHFTGPTSAPEAALARMDIFALTSDTEQMPLSILEAMASSLPIVSFGVGDVPQMVSVQNRVAASIPAHDDERFIELLLEFAIGSEKRVSVGSSNRMTVKTRFDLNQMALAYAAVFDRDARMRLKRSS